MSDVLSSLTGWTSQPFMLRALLALVLLAPACAALGVHVVSFRMAFFSDAISHSVFTGIALGLLLSLDVQLSTIVFGLLLGVLLIQLGRHSSLSRDALIAVLLAIAMSLGIVIVSMRKGLVQQFQAVLYGDILTLTSLDVALTGIVLLGTLIFELVAFNKLLLISTSEALARTHGIRAQIWETLLALWVAVVALIGLRLVGLLMVTSLMVVPAAAARNLARGARGALIWSVIIAELSSVAGLAASWALDSATGATVILVAAVLFLATLPFGSRVRRS
ncbi:MAG: metal ABC transporter permease [bacterium]